MAKRTKTPEHWLAAIEDPSVVRWRLVEASFERQRRGDDDPMTWHRKFEGTVVKCWAPQGPRSPRNSVAARLARSVSRLRLHRDGPVSNGTG